MTKLQLRRSFENSHGIGVVNGYNETGFVGTWNLRYSSQIDRMPDGVLYYWV